MNGIHSVDGNIAYSLQELIKLIYKTKNL